MWCIHSTLSIALVCFVSLYLGYGERGAYINAVFALLLSLAFVLTRGPSTSNGWTHACIASLFSLSAAAMLITLCSVLARPPGSASYGWELASGLVAVLAMVAICICANFFFFVAARELNLKYSRAVLGFSAQAAAFFIIFRFGPWFMHKYFGV